MKPLVRKRRDRWFVYGYDERGQFSAEFTAWIDAVRYAITVYRAYYEQYR